MVIFAHSSKRHLEPLRPVLTRASNIVDAHANAVDMARSLPPFVRLRNVGLQKDARFSSRSVPSLACAGHPFKPFALLRAGGPSDGLSIDCDPPGLRRPGPPSGSSALVAGRLQHKTVVLVYIATGAQSVFSQQHVPTRRMVSNDTVLNVLPIYRTCVKIFRVPRRSFQEFR